jgi:DNA polymerase III epsilon subunit-like protein
MANVKQCSRCKSNIDISYFSINRKKEYYKTCNRCRSKRNKTNVIFEQTSLIESLSEQQPIVESLSEQQPSEQLQLELTKENIIIFDIEHTGCSEAFILQLSWGIYKEDGTLQEMKDYYLKPENEIFIHPRAQIIHGITYESLLEEENSLDVKTLLKSFTEDLKHCKRLVAHNLNGDLKTLNKELFRHDMDEINVETYCTMKETKKFCNVKDKINRIKNPRISELYKKLFNEDIDYTKAHNSCYDVELCAKCYFQYLTIG